MSGHPQHPQGGYDDGYGQQQHHPNDAYYQDDRGYNDQYYDERDQRDPRQHGGQGYYDES